MRVRVWIIVYAVALRTAGAAPSPEQAARATTLFEQGRTLVDANQIDAACQAFEDSLRLDPQIGTKLNLADCRERQGRLVEAYTIFSAAANEAAKTGKEARETFARGRAQTLAARLAHVTLRVVDPDVPGLSIKLGAEELKKAEWAQDRLVVAGTIVIQATAAGRTAIKIEKALKAGSAVVIDVPAPEPITAAPIEPPIDGGPSTPHASRIPWVIGGAGAVLLLGSVAIGLHAKARYDDAVKIHDTTGVGSSQSEADSATWVAAVGAVAVTVGVVLYLRGRNLDSVVVAPSADGGTASVTLRGAW